MTPKYLWTALLIFCQSYACNHRDSSSVDECIVCRNVPPDTATSPYLDCNSVTGQTFDDYCAPIEGMTILCESVMACCERAPLGSAGCPTVVRTPTDKAPTLNNALSAVPGEIVFSGTYATETHLFSIVRSTQEIFQLTRSSRQYRSISIGPDRRLVLFTEMDANDQSSVWLLNLETKEEKRISPIGCDAGIGGLGWFNDTFVGFAMKCTGDNFSQAYLANIYDANDKALMRKLTQQDADVVEVYPILNSSFFLYVRVEATCSEPRCTLFSTIWMGDNELTEQQCQVTQPIQTDDNPERAITAEIKRLGDFRPTISSDLQSITFSRTVGAKPQGPIGHHDLFLTDTDLRSLLAGASTCGTGIERSLTSTLESDRWISETGTLAILSETGPTIPFDGSQNEVSHLFVGTTHGTDSDSGVYEASIAGTLTRRTPRSMQVFEATWVQDSLDIQGTR